MSAALMDNYRRADIAFDRGEGAYLFAADGRRYLDFCSGIAVTGLEEVQDLKELVMHRLTHREKLINF